MLITRKSMFSGTESTMDLDVTAEQLERWQGGELIQNVFSHLTAGEREFIKTGVTPEEWAETFGEG